MVNLFLILFSSIAACICFIVSAYIGEQAYAQSEKEWEKEVLYIWNTAFDKGIGILGLIFLSWVCIGIFEAWDWGIMKRIFSLINSLLMLWSLKHYTDRPYFLKDTFLIKTLNFIIIGAGCIILLLSIGNDLPKYIYGIDFTVSIIIWILVSMSLWSSFNTKRGMKYMRGVVILMFLCCFYTQIVELAFEEIEKNKFPSLKTYVETTFDKIPDTVIFLPKPTADIPAEESNTRKKETLRSIGRLLYRPLFLLCVLMLSLTWLRKIESSTPSESTSPEALKLIKKDENALIIEYKEGQISFTLYLPSKSYEKTVAVNSYTQNINLPYFYLYFLAKCHLVNEGLNRHYFSKHTDFDIFKREVSKLYENLSNDEWMEVNEGVLKLKVSHVYISMTDQEKIESVLRTKANVQDKLKLLFKADHEKVQALVASLKS